MCAPRSRESPADWTTESEGRAHPAREACAAQCRRLGMGHREIKPSAVPWFKIDSYAEAYKIDASDWFLNLSLRGAIARGQCVGASEYVRGLKPVIVRAEKLTFELARIRDQLPGDFARILDGKEPSLGVESLTAQELYYFERRLPETIRQFGGSHALATMRASKPPDGFLGPLDNLFEARYTNAFVRIDLSLRDETLVEGLRAFLTRERRAIAAIGGKQPFAAALRRYTAKLDRLAEYGVLPYLDLDQLRRERGMSLRPAAFARLLGVSDDDLRETRRIAKAILDDFVLHGSFRRWLLDAAHPAAGRK